MPSGTFKAVTAGYEHSCGLRSNNTITCWGNNSEGQTVAPAGTFKAVTAGYEHSCGLRSNNTITCWGSNNHAQADAPSGTFKAVTAGFIHSCGLRSNNTITCWGNNGSGQTVAPAGTFKAVTAGGLHSCGLRSNNTITCWGYNSSAQIDAPAGTFKAVTAGGLHSCGLRSNDTITCWGRNPFGQTVAHSGTFKAVTAGYGHSCGLRSNGAIVCWGYNEDGQTDAHSGTFKAVTAGGEHSCGLRSNGVIVCWGAPAMRTADPVGGVLGGAGVHQPAVDALYELGVFEGTGCVDGSGLCPSEPMRRWEMAVWLVRALDQVEPPAVGESSFADVDFEKWWLPHVERLAELEVTKGCLVGPLRFCPDRSVTRAQMAAFLVRALDLESAEPAGFTDTAGNTHETDIDALAAARVTAGCATGPLRYCPERSVTRAEMATFLARALGLVEVPAPIEEEPAAFPGAGVSVAAGRDNSSSGYFQAELYKLLLEELGYTVSDPAELELGPSLAYSAMAQGEMDYWPNSWYPFDLAWLAGELPDGSLVEDHVTIVGEEMLAGGLQGFLVTKSFADEYGVYTMDELNSNADALAAFDATDSNPGNGIADIFGCPQSWTCDNIIENQIAFSGWDNISQISAGYDAMFAQAVDNVGEGIPMVLFTWTPTPYITELRPGDNVYWMGMERVLDDSNPANQEGGEEHDQRGADGSGGYASISADQCPSAADQPSGRCKIGWITADILVTANSDFLAANPAAEALFEVVKLSVIDVSLANAAQNEGESPTSLAAQWIADNRNLADRWLTTARAAGPARAPAPIEEEPAAFPGAGVSVAAGRANWSSGYFQAELYKLLLEELGYTVSDPAELELWPHNGYIAMAHGEMDFWPNSWYPVHLAWLADELPDDAGRRPCHHRG